MEKDDVLQLIKQILDHPMTPPEIRRRLPKHLRGGLSQKLNQLEHAGEIVKIRYGRYGLANQMNLVTGRLQGHADGYGFVIPEGGAKGNDVFVGPANFREAMHGDRVVCRIESTRRDGKVEGKIIRVMERAQSTITGIYQSRGRGGVIVPSQKRIVHPFQVRPGASHAAKSGEVVVGKITLYPDEHTQPEAEVIEIIGFPDSPIVQRQMIVRQYEIPEEFPPAALKIAERCEEPVEKDVKGRSDFRGAWVATIDGEDAKDFDDAVSIKTIPHGYELGVHIADVSSYVQPNNALDIAAYERGTSTYFPGTVLPMLPFQLSNNVCSLRPHINRLTLSVLIRINGLGEILGYQFSPGVIRSTHRLTYTEVARILENPDTEPDREKASNLLLMKELCLKLNKKRMADGGLDFDIPEPKIALDEKGEPVGITRAERNIAHRLVEEFMLSANRCAANFLSDKPSIYRVHPAPDKILIEEFFDFAARLGYVTNPKQNMVVRLQDVLKKAEGHTDEKLLNYVMLRHMKQACYQPENTGHFGLSFEEYTHFTSPIRRYPDLIVHRLIKAKLDGVERYLGHDGLTEAGVHCSAMERRSERAERDVKDMLKVRYMAGHEGETYDGIITGVTAFGIFVEMGDLMIEGLLRLTDLHDDYYEYHEKEHMLMGKRTKRIFRLGSPAKVLVKHVDVLKREITLNLAEMADQKPGRPGKRPPEAGKRGKFQRKEGKRRTRGR